MCDLIFHCLLSRLFGPHITACMIEFWETTMSKKTLYIVLVIVVIVFIGAAGLIFFNSTPAETPSEPVTLKLNWYHGVQFLGFYIAQQKGYYDDVNLDVTIAERTKDDDAIPTSVASGKLDFSVGGSIQRAQAEGEAVTVVASIFQLAPEAFFARADSGINQPADMAGHTVVVKSPGWKLLVEDLLAVGGLTLSDIESVEAGFDMTPFYNGEVEVWGGFLNDEVVRARMKGLDLITFPLYEYGIQSSNMVITTGQDYLTEHPDRVQRFVEASLRGWEWAMENPTEAVDIMLKMYPDLADEREFHLISFDATIPLIRPPGVRIGALDCDEWVSHELLANIESTDRLCTEEILEAIWN